MRHHSAHATRYDFHAVRAACAAVILLLCVSGVRGGATQPSQSDRSPDSFTDRVARSRRGMVVSSSPLATAVGLRVLEHGGNAVDAAVATAFTLAVVEIGSFGLGGRLQMLLRTPEGELVGFDGTIQVPAGYVKDASHDGVGYTTIGVPGAVAALGKAHRLHGSKPFADLLAPAILLAETGFVLSVRQARSLTSLAPQLKRFDGSRRQYFKPDGSAYETGERFRQPDLGHTLRTLANQGADAFYRGDMARLISTDMETHGGSLRASDLAAYEARASRIVRGSYRGYELIGTHAPAAGSTVVEVMHILEHFDLARAGSAEWAAFVAQALRLGFQDQYRDFGGPEKAASTMTSKAWAAQRAKHVVVPGGSATAARNLFTGWLDPGHTTHFSVADARGGLVASTQTLGSGMGAKVVTPGLGFLYAATMGFPGAFASQPGQRATSSMSPFLVLKDGKPAFVLGAAGGMRIISSIVEVLSRVIDQKMPFHGAVAAPRVHPDPGSYIEAAGEEFALEASEGRAWPAVDVSRLQQFGFKVLQQKQSFATIHGIWFDAGRGEYVGVADPRGNGSAQGPK